MKPEDEEALRLADEADALLAKYPTPKNRASLTNQLAIHLRRLVADNERMRKALEDIDKSNSWGEADDIIRAALTPTPAVEAQDKPKCGTCGGAGHVDGGVDRRGDPIPFRCGTCRGTGDAPDCATKDGAG